eukprot:13011-Pelagomonas_calceolata.AAC.5
MHKICQASADMDAQDVLDYPVLCPCCNPSAVLLNGTWSHDGHFLQMVHVFFYRKYMYMVLMAPTTRHGRMWASPVPGNASTVFHLMQSWLA